MKKLIFLLLFIPSLVFSQTNVSKWFKATPTPEASIPTRTNGMWYYSSDSGHFTFYENNKYIHLASTEYADTHVGGYPITNTPSTGNTLVFDGGDLNWQTTLFSISSSTDANIISPSNNQILQYQTSDNKWHNHTLVAGDISAVPTSRQITINGNTQNLASDPSWTIVAGVSSFNSRTGAISPQLGDYNFSLISGTAQTNQGGTGVTSVTTAPTANAFAGWDSNSNLSASNFLDGYTTTSTAAGTTTLTVASSYYQYFTGTTTQTLVLPVTSTLNFGHRFWIQNNSTGVVTVTSSGGNTIYAMSANSILTVQCILTSGTTASSWAYNYYPPNPMTTVGDMVIGGTVVNGYATPTRVAASTLGYVFTSNGPGVAPSWQPGGGLSGLTTNGVVVAASSSTVGTVSDLTYSARSLFVGLGTSGTNTLLLGPSGSSGFSLNTTTGEFRSNAITSHFQTWTVNSSEVMRISGSTKNLLIGTTTDNSKLTVNGSFAPGYVAKATSYTATINEYTIEVTATGQTITLPTAVGITGRIYIVKLTASGSGTVNTTSSQTIDGSTTYSLSALNKYVIVQSNGANWIIIGNN